MRNALIVLVTVLALFCFAVPAMATEEFIGFDANVAAVLRVIVVNAADGNCLNIKTKVFEDYNGTTANYYITPTTAANSAALGLFKGDMPSGAPACSYYAIWQDTVLTPNKLVYTSPLCHWSGTAKNFAADANGRVDVATIYDVNANTAIKTDLMYRMTPYKSALTAQ